MNIKIRQHLYLFILSILLVSSCKQTEVTPKKNIAIDNQHLLLGNPINATADINNENNFLLTRPQYVFSCSKVRATPNWVSWHVSADWLGQADRQNDFRLDEDLPTGWYRVTL